MNYKLIAEIGGNHKGSIDIAVEMIKIAATKCNVDVIKFQKRSNKTLLSEEEYNAPHPIPENSYGSTYGEHREFLEFDLDQHRFLKKECENLDTEYSCSVWDLLSAKEIISLKPNIIKVPSSQNLNFELLQFICESFENDIHISLGMTTQSEIEEIYKETKKYSKNMNTVFYHCTSDYPADYADLNLLEITELSKKYNGKIKNIAFSGHHKGISMDIAAATLGAKYIERHFTLDRTWKGTDHAASLEPQGMEKLKRDLIHLSIALKNKDDPNSILKNEVFQYNKLKWKKN